jgi:hypothetical protein
MPIQQWIERDKKRIRAVVVGALDIEEIYDAINRAIDDPDFEQGYDILSDHTGIDTALTRQQVLLTASHLETLTDHLAGTKWAVVTEKDASYGMMRMLSVFLEAVPIQLEVFRSLDEAEAWLDS